VGAKKTTLETLEDLGARRLAELLLEFGEEDAEIKRRLRLELAGEAGAEVIAADITKRLVALRRARSFIDWPKRRSFVKDIDLQREMIATKVAETRPDLALDLMWRFMDLAEPILNRVDDSYGDVGDVFRQACRDLGAIAGKAVSDPIQLADRVFQAVTTNDYGEYDQLIHVIFSALREPGLARLKSRLSCALAERPKTNDHYDSETAALQHALQDIADGEGDVDAYMAHESAASRKSPKVAAEIATRLLAAGRAEEAHAVLEGGSPEPGPPWSIDWELAWVEALLATDRRDEAQSFRWSCFEHRLDASHLRAYLKALPDFEDVPAEEKALDYALAFPDFTTALAFFIDWKQLRYAARLVLERSVESDGNVYFLLDPAAKALEGKHPLAATLLRRAMIEDTLNGVKSKRYRHAARHVLECQALDRSIEDYAAFETHDAFVNRIHAKHGRKTGFWSRVAELTASPAARPQI
jgi:hypothetical protein